MFMIFFLRDPDIQTANFIICNKMLCRKMKTNTYKGQQKESPIVTCICLISRDQHKTHLSILRHLHCRLQCHKPLVSIFGTSKKNYIELDIFPR